LLTTEISHEWRSEGRDDVHTVRQTNGGGGARVVKELQDIAGLGSLLRENDES